MIAHPLPMKNPSLTLSATILCCAFLLLISSCSATRDFAAIEQDAEFSFTPEVRVLINTPKEADPSRPVLLILYALPNGNSIEMTAGKKMTPGLDWHYDIQHIAAQTRFLRRALHDRTVIVAYLEAAQKSWPAWRKKYLYDDAGIGRIVDYVRFETGNPDRVVLAGHSGGGSFITGFLNAYDTIPSYIERIAYLDANYSYDDSLHHGAKLLQWLKADTLRKLSVMAYDDREIVLNGKKIIGPTGGTYRATQRMKQRFVMETELVSQRDSLITVDAALNGRARFFVHTNPDTLILHTVMVERNGLIHSLLLNTPLEEKEYRFFGERAYTHFISSHPTDNR